MTKLLLIFALVSSLVGTALAQHAPRAARRQSAQKARIAEGVQSGDLTRRETEKLAVEQANIKATKQAAKADGVVTPLEKATIERKQDRASRHIRREKNDRQHR